MLWQSDVPLVSTTCCSIENLNQLSNIMSDSKSKFKNTGRGEAVFVTEIITGLYSCYIGEGNGNPLVLLPGKLHGWRSLVGYSPWGRKESDTTERLHFRSFYRSFWRRKWQPIPVFLPGESHGQRGLVGYSLWGCKALYTTKQLTHT